MELREYIQQNWNGRDFLKISSNKEMRSAIERQTSFLNVYYDNLLLKQRAYFIVNDITVDNIPKCSCGCGKLVELNRDATKGFRKFHSEECHRSADKIPKEALEKLSNKEWLYHERVVLKKAIEVIGNELGISHVPVTKWLKKHGIKNLTIRKIRNLEAYKIIDDKEKLINLYNSGLTCEQIAEPLNVTKGLIARTLKSYGVALRTPNSYERKINRVSGEEQELINFITGVYSGKIKTSNRSILNGRELDLHLPELNLAIEYNGLYSHSYKPWEERESLIKGPNYHLNKTLDCEKQGIRLIHIFSDEWNYKRSIVESIIKSKLGLNYRIYARKCSVVEVGVLDKNNFLNANHIQGEDKSGIKLGLQYNGELVCLMTFNKSRFNKNYEWELVRFCNKSGLNVVGGFSKLLKAFRNSYNGSVVSYADRRWSDGGVYLKNGFELIRVNKPAYYYVDRDYLIRHNRMKFQKKLIGAYKCTEYEKAREMGFNRIYDCGSLCFGLN